MEDDQDFLALKLVYDNRAEAYKDFFDHEWCKQLCALVRKTKLDPLALDLCQNWKGTSMVARMPWLIADGLHRFQESFLRGGTSPTAAVMDALADDLQQSADLSNMARQRLRTRISNIKQRLNVELETVSLPFSRDDIWKQYLEIREFPWSLWSLERQCYASVYFAYEHFIGQAVEVTGAGLGKTGTPFERLKQGLASCTNAVFGDQCMDETVDTARLVRNCLAHSGGRESEQLRRRSHGLRIEAGYIQILPENVRSLYDALKERALRLATFVNSATHFQST